ncbi:hypothetical protein RHGRI_031404 [Rhododendron griersonianum]|uniref:Trafficking protein particle complex subunit 8 n=1 Tax=Rhododendron griersonianum TaxID=479676 RepID=A0AAV6I826_9ERIC|nr:hypothetical protein RHGRI_031404 [Rhododendron griersonianum]
MADPANSPLGRMLLDEISPVVMVLRTDLVEEACHKNNLSLVEMLKPFCAFNNIDVPVRTASDQPYRIQKFKLRLFYSSDIRQPNVEVAKERLKQVITNAGEKDISDLCTEPPQIETVLTTSQSELLPPWFPFFNKELVHTVSFSDHEAFDHPVACLVVVSSKDEEPINKFIDLFNTGQLPSLLNNGAMDPQIMKYYLLLHDNQDGTPEIATKILSEMRNTFGSNDCGLMCINSSQDGLEEHQENPWALHKAESSPGQHLGCFLNNDDRDELKIAMQDLSSKHIIPHMEQKIRVLNQQVAVTRKGFRNQIKNLWWRKGKEDTPDSLNGPMYTFSSIESQIRVLGDYAFMLRDYDLALSNYRLLSTDYKLDKSWNRYAGVQEMMGLTYFLFDQSRKDAEYCMENAFNTYLKMGLSGQRNATRCGLWWVEMLKTRDQFKEAAAVYLRISGEEPLHAAVMLEQASYCYLFAKPPMLRKYGFHLVLSGDLYKKCDQMKHAIRTYRRALTVFKGTKWSHIRDHVHFHIGKWYAFLGMSDVAVKHIMEVLACGHQSKTTQELFLRDFFQIVQKTGKTFEVLRLQLPVIDMPSLKVVYEDHRTYASSEAVSVKESVWQSLEEDMVPASSAIRNNWLESQPKLALKKYKESNVSVAGEAIKVEIGFKNPLQIPISVSSVSLICEHSVRSDETEADANCLTTENQSDDQVRNVDTSRERSSEKSPFTVSEVDISLGGGQTLLAQLTVTPKLEGALKIVGVRWKLSGSVSGFCNFGTEMVKKKVQKKRGKTKRLMTDNLEFMVIKALPKLEGFIHHLPKTVYEGDLQRLDLVLKNPSELSVRLTFLLTLPIVLGQNMKMKISHPRYLIIGNQEVMDMEFPACLERKTKSAWSDEHAKTNYTHDERVFLFPEDALVYGETPFTWPLWLRAATHGNISLYLTLYYEMGDTSTVMKYRILRMHYNLEVLPSLDVSFLLRPCPLRLHEFLLQMDVINRTSSKSFQIQQLSSFGNNWEISLLQPLDAIFPSELLLAGQALSCFFKLKNARKSAITKDKDSAVGAVGPSEGSDVSLSCSCNEPLFDIYRPPLVDFHQYERTEQGTSVYSIASTSPIWWLVEGPRTIQHNFSASFCEIKLKMTIHNSSNEVASIRINTSDSTSSSNTTASVPSGNEEGWHDISLLNDVKVSSIGKPPSQECVSPFIWSGASSTHIKLEPMSTTEIPLQLCVFSPGTYDLSNYVLHWTLLPSDDQRAGTRQSLGTCQGHPYCLTVLQSS